MQAGLYAAGTFDIKNYGVNECTGNVNAKDIKYKNQGVDKVTAYIVKNGSADFDINGMSDMKVDFNGENAYVNCNGVGNIEMSVNCKKLDANVNGKSKLKLSGTADDVNFEGNGVSRIDAGELNKY